MTGRIPDTHVPKSRFCSVRPVGAGLIVSRPQDRETPAGTRLLAPAGRELSGMAGSAPRLPRAPPCPGHSAAPPSAHPHHGPRHVSQRRQGSVRSRKLFAVTPARPGAYVPGAPDIAEITAAPGHRPGVPDDRGQLTDGRVRPDRLRHILTSPRTNRDKLGAKPCVSEDMSR